MTNKLCVFTATFSDNSQAGEKITYPIILHEVFPDGFADMQFLVSKCGDVDLRTLPGFQKLGELTVSGKLSLVFSILSPDCLHAIWQSIDDLFAASGKPFPQKWPYTFWWAKQINMDFVVTLWKPN